MRYDKTVLLNAFLALSVALSHSAQARAQETFGIESGQTPAHEASAGYTFIHANAPPGQCGCFSANGGYGSGGFNMPRGFGIVADLASPPPQSLGFPTQ